MGGWISVLKVDYIVPDPFLPNCSYAGYVLVLQNGHVFVLNERIQYNIMYTYYYVMPAGLVPKRQGEVEKEHHEAGEQPSGDQFHGESEPERAVRSRSNQRAHAGLAGSELCRPVLMSPLNDPLEGGGASRRAVSSANRVGRRHMRFPISIASDLTRSNGCAYIVHNVYFLYLSLILSCPSFNLSHNQNYPPCAPSPFSNKSQPLHVRRATLLVPTVPSR